MKAILPSSLLLAGLLLSVSCTGPEGASGADGKEGAAGVPGASCWATPVDDGFLMVCGADTVGVLKNGADGAKGSDGAKGDKGDKGSKGDKGADGASCTSVSIEVNGVHGVEITCGTAKDTVMNGAQGAQGENGEQGDKGDKGDDGAAGTTCTASEITDGTADGYWLYCDGNLVGVLRNGAYGQDGADGADGQDGQNGADGQNGQDGASCHVEALPNDAGYSLYCGDEYIGDILNGRDGQDGQDGADGASCTLASIDVNGVHGVEITCGAQKDTVMNGAQGIQGVKGDAGADGADGVDGASCSGVSLGDTAVVISCGGVVVDTLFNGKNGADGAQGAQGEQGIQGVKGDDGSSCTGRAIDGVGIEISCGDVVVDTLRNGQDGQNGQDGVGCTGEKIEGALIVTCGDVVDTLYDGEAGASGRGIHWLGHLDAAPADPQVNDIFYYEGFGVTCLWNGTSWDLFFKDAGAHFDHCPTPEEAANLGVFVDTRDGKSYGWVKIGDQVWMASNLNYGTQVTGSTNQSDAADTIAQKWCYNDDSHNCAQYGALYQWHTAMGLAQSDDDNYATLSGETQGICPDGWHVPTRAEFNTLQSALTAAGETAGSSLFGALLGGYRNNGGMGAGWRNLNTTAYWWTANQRGQGNNQRTQAYYATWNSTTISTTEQHDKSDYGYALRCVRNAD